ncbi:MAG: phosphoribosyltransferase [Candidatus Micrarchaeota archaeon]
MEFLYLSWDKAAQMCERLSEKIDFVPDMLVGISRGGLVPVRILSDKLGVNDVGVMGIGFYKSVGQTSKFPQITQELSKDVEGKKVLVVDDIADTGRSLVVAKEYLRRKKAAKIKIATLHYKPASQLKPDYFMDTTTRWVVYPWEQHEVARELKK